MDTTSELSGICAATSRLREDLQRRVVGIHRQWDERVENVIDDELKAFLFDAEYDDARHSLAYHGTARKVMTLLVLTCADKLA